MRSGAARALLPDSPVPLSSGGVDAIIVPMPRPSLSPSCLQTDSSIYLSQVKAAESAFKTAHHGSRRNRQSLNSLSTQCTSLAREIVALRGVIVSGDPVNVVVTTMATDHIANMTEFSGFSSALLFDAVSYEGWPGYELRWPAISAEPLAQVPGHGLGAAGAYNQLLGQVREYPVDPWAPWRGLDASVDLPILNETIEPPQTIDLHLQVNEVYAGILIAVRRRFLTLAVVCKLLIIKMMAHAMTLCTCLIAIISVFMSHRHRHEPAGGRLLSNCVKFGPWRVAVGR